MIGSDEEFNSTYFFNNGKPKGEYFDLIQSALNSVIEKKGGNCGLSTSIWANQPDLTLTPGRHCMPSIMNRNAVPTSVSSPGPNGAISSENLLAKYGGLQNSRRKFSVAPEASLHQALNVPTDFYHDGPAGSFMQTSKFMNPAYVPPHRRIVTTTQKVTRQQPERPVKNTYELSAKTEEFNPVQRSSSSTNILSASAANFIPTVQINPGPTDHSNVSSVTQSSPSVVDDSSGGVNLDSFIQKPTKISPQKSIPKALIPEEQFQAYLLKDLQERELRSHQSTSPSKIQTVVMDKALRVAQAVPSEEMSDISPTVSAKLAEYATIARPTMRENDFMAMLLKREEEQAGKNQRRILQKTQENIPCTYSRSEDNFASFPVELKPKTLTNFGTVNAASPTSLNVADPDLSLPTGELKEISVNCPSGKTIFSVTCFGPASLTLLLPVTKQPISPKISDISNMDAMSTQKPLVAAPDNPWMRVRLSQGKLLSKADEEFQAFIDKKNVTPEQPKNVLTKKPSPQKPTYAEAEENRPKLAIDEAQLAEFLPRHSAKATLEQSTKPAALHHSPAPKDAIRVNTLAPLTPEGNSVQAVSSDVQERGSVEVAALRPAQNQDTSDARKFEEVNIAEMRKNDDVKLPNGTKLVKDDLVAGWNTASHMAVGTSHANQNKDIVQMVIQANANIDKVIPQEKKQPASFASSPPFWSVSSISDVGEKPSNPIANIGAREGVRATQTQDARIGLVDWDGKTWMPPPIWEERGDFDTGFISAYITEWAAAVARPPDLVDVSSEEFWSGKSVVNNYILVEAPIHDPDLPDIKNSSSEVKRLNQTARKESELYIKKLEKSQKSREMSITQSQMHQQTILAREPEPNPFRPKIDTYLRPAIESDSTHILQIYNHYIDHSYIPEDQDPLTEGDILFLINNAKEEKLPFIVAVKGRVPMQSPQAKRKTKLPQYEHIIGFAFSEARGCGISGKINGRSRYTTNMHLYVDHNFARKGIGRSLMDRMLQLVSRAYAAKDGYDWLNPDLDPVYETDGTRRCHQIVIELPVLKNNDPNYLWIKEFLKGFWIMEESRLKCVGRTSTKERRGEWLDIVYFQTDAAHADEFNPYE
ncbi:acyl- n-acyltransferase protein [Rutstroemia sp. NJR-2017a BVV2]|nr:acyl- n-acyltransferase protein [Rutstroemia sp. NJR-2017a BVV2]